MNAEATARTASNRLWKSILQLASGSAISQIIVLLTTPVLTRYYTPRDFGVVAFFASFLMFLSPLSSLNYYQAIILPENEGDSFRLGRLCITISLGFSLFFLGSTFLLRKQLDVLFKMPELVSFFWVFPAAILIRSVYLILAAFMSRYRAFLHQSNARVCQTLSERSLSLLIGFAGQASSLMLVFARFASLAVETGMLYIAFLRRPKVAEGETPCAKTTRELAFEYREFPLFSSWAMLLANGSSQLPLLLLPLLFTPAVGGFFALGNRLFQLPMQLLGESIRNAYYKEVSDCLNKGIDNSAGFLSLRNHLVAVGMFPFIFLLFFGDFVFSLFFGSEWAPAGTYAGILGFFFFFQFISSPITCIFNAYKQQKYLVIISSLLFINNLMSLLLGAYLGSPTKGFIVLTVNGILIYIFMSYLAEKTLKLQHSSQFLTYAKYLAYNLPFILLFFVVKSVTQNTSIIFTASLVFSAGYYSLIYRHKLGRFLHRKGIA